MNIVISIVVDCLCVWNEKVSFFGNFSSLNKVSRVNAFWLLLLIASLYPLKTIYSCLLTVFLFTWSGATYFIFKGIVNKNRTTPYQIHLKKNRAISFYIFRCRNHRK